MSDLLTTTFGEIADHRPHAFHATDRDWPESNCYVDIWIEILHGLGLPVAPIFPFTLACDFEGDQWTFYKPPHADLFKLYGIDVEELIVWKDLTLHCVEQISRGRMPLVEMDSFHLPDTQGRSYRKTHEKTTIGIQRIDPERQTLQYFHNRGLYQLEGVDFRGLFRIDPKLAASALPPFCEFIKLDHLVTPRPEDLREMTLELVRSHIARRPTVNPIKRYAETVEAQLVALIEADSDTYDLYAFATIRQCGSCFAFSADTLRWLAQEDMAWSNASLAFAKISSIASMLVLKMARIVYSERLKSLEESFKEMADAWDLGMNEIDKQIQK